MKRIIWIPIVGTIAAILAVIATHESPKKEGAAVPGTGLERESRSMPLQPVHYVVEVEKDGKLQVKGQETLYESVAALLKKIAPPGVPAPVVLLENATGVSEQALEKAAAALRSKTKVTKRYRAANEEGK